MKDVQLSLSEIKPLFEGTATPAAPIRDDSQVCQSIEWYTEGQTRIAEVNGVQITIRFVGRHGRRARIAISGPPGTIFRAEDGHCA